MLSNKKIIQFLVCTILTGLGLGAFLVFISDCVSPRKAPLKNSYKVCMEILRKKILLQYLKKEDAPDEERKEVKTPLETKPRRRTRKAE